MKRISRRKRLRNGAWEYAKPREQEFAFALSSTLGLDLPAFDAFLETPGVWRSKAARKNRKELLELRASALETDALGNYELSEMTARLMFCEAHRLGIVNHARRFVVGRKKSDSNLKHGKRFSDEQIASAVITLGTQEKAAESLGCAVKTVSRRMGGMKAATQKSKQRSTKR